MAVKNSGNASKNKNTVVVKNPMRSYVEEESNRSSSNTHRSSLNGNGSGFTSQVLCFMAKAKNEV